MLRPTAIAAAAMLLLVVGCAADIPTGTADPGVNAGPVTNTETMLIGVLRYNDTFYSLELDDGSLYALHDTPPEFSDLIDRRIWIDFLNGEIVSWAPLEGGRGMPRAPLYVVRPLRVQ